jgi:hypothetical protein
MEYLQSISKEIQIKQPTIECRGIQFYTIKDAAEHFGCSDERIRQKLKSEKHTDFIYLFEEK